MFSYVNFPGWIRPEVVSFLPVRWYAVMYIVAFSVAYVVFRKYCRLGALGKMNAETSTDLFLYAIVGLILGARIGSCLLYEGSFYYFTHPWMMFWPFRNGVFVGLPGMSYHGGVLGAFLGVVLFAKKNGYRILDLCDGICVSVPLGYTFGRLGNFINGELWGRCTGTSYGMIFPDAPRFSTNEEWVRLAAEKAGIAYSNGSFVNLPRHPSQLYEAFFEGIVLFFVMWFLVRPLVRNRNLGRGVLTGAYIGGYGLVRFVIEYFREPDSRLGFVIALGKETEPVALFRSVLNISMGQVLCFIMILIGAVLIFRGCRLEPADYSGKGADKGKKNRKKR